MSFEFDDFDDGIDWTEAMQSVDVLESTSATKRNNPSSLGKQNMNVSHGDAPPGFGRNRRQNQFDSNQNTNVNNHNLNPMPQSHSNNIYKPPVSHPNASHVRHNNNNYSSFTGNNNNSRSNARYPPNSNQPYKNSNHPRVAPHSNHNNNANHNHSNHSYNHHNQNDSNQYHTPTKKKNHVNQIRRQQKQQKLTEFMQAAPFSDDIPNEPLPDKDLVHREIKKFNHKRVQLKIPLMDEEASKMWVYPSNLEIRRYQFESTKQALFTNELVCLPTGMGKTLIAAVVMYNFHRWYPKGIIVFACPTRALVEQQMQACHDFLDIPQSDYADLTGRTAPKRRVQLWKNHRLYFVSPQTLKSDLSRNTVPVDKFVCIVIDEAHKAQGEHSFHTMTRDMMATNGNIRILALSATPGSNQEQIQTLISNLRLSRMIIKYDDDPDIKPYRHETTFELIKCPLTASMRELKNSLLGWIGNQLNQLFRFEAIRGFQPDTITAWNCQNEFGLFGQRSERSNRFNASTKWLCVGRFMCLQRLVILREKLEHYSVQVMLKKLDETIESVQDNPHKNRVLSKLLHETPFNEWKMLCQEEVRTKQLHPKMKALAQILEDHFTHCEYPNSRVIVFSSLRHSVVDIVDNLKPFEHCKPYHFVGQASGKSGKGLSNKQQQQVILDFKSGKYNILVSTCVGEEGLDIGQVDIVVHYDIISNVLRNVQRSGRTGRKRRGRVVYLCSTNREQDAYRKMKLTKQSIRKIDINRYQYFENAPRMFPNGFNPSLIRTELEPPANFIGLSARKAIQRYQRMNLKSIYQSKSKGNGLITMTQTAAFANKYELDENELENRMPEIIEDAVEHCYHIQSEFNVGEIKPSETTKFMVRLFRTIEDEQELEMEYQHLFPKRQRTQSEQMVFCVDDDEFEDDPYGGEVVINKKKKIRAARPLYSDADAYEKTPSPKRGRKKKNEVFIIQDNDALDSDYASLMDTDSDDCKVLGTERKKKRKRDTHTRSSKKKRKKKKKKKSLYDWTTDEDLDNGGEIDLEPQRKKRKIQEKQQRKPGEMEDVQKKSTKTKKKRKKKKKQKKKKPKETETSDSCMEMLDLCHLHKEEPKDTDHRLNNTNQTIEYEDPMEDNHCNEEVEDEIEILTTNCKKQIEMEYPIDIGMDYVKDEPMTPVDEKLRMATEYIAPFITPGGAIVMPNQKHVLKAEDVDENADDSVLYHDYRPSDSESPKHEYAQQRQPYNDKMEEDQDEEEDDTYHPPSPVHKVCEDLNEWDMDETGFIPDDALLAMSEDHNNAKPKRIKMMCPKIADNPWNKLNKTEKKEVQMLMDEMMPTPRLDPTKVPSFKTHIEASRELIHFMRMKTSQMDSFRAMQSFWPFDAPLIQKLKDIFRDIDRNNAAWTQYGQQCRDIMDDKYEYIKAPSPDPMMNEARRFNHNYNHSSNHNQPHTKDEHNTSNNNSNIASASSFTRLQSVEHRLSICTLSDAGHTQPSQSDTMTHDVVPDISDHEEPTNCRKRPCEKPVITQQETNATNNELVPAQPTMDTLIKCPLCGSLFDTVQAVGVHIDNDHNENNAPSPAKPRTQPLPIPIEPETPMLPPTRRRRRNKQRLILSAESPLTHSTKRKHQICDISAVSDETPAIKIRTRSKKRKISDISEDTTHTNNTAASHKEEQLVSQIHADDYAEIEAMHSDHEGVSSGHESEHEIDNHYDLDDTFINNATQSPLKTQQRLGYRKALKTPKDVLKRLYGENLRKQFSQIQRLETSVCNESHIESEYQWNEMEGYEDPDDPILPPWDPHKEGMCHDKDEESSSDDDELNIRQRMKRAYVDQTQQRMSTPPPPTRSRKRRWSDRTDRSHSPLHTSCSQMPKRRRLIQKPIKDSPFFSQPSINITHLSDISPIHHNNHNHNESHGLTSDLLFLDDNEHMFYAEVEEYLPQTGAMIVRTPFRSNQKTQQNRPLVHMEDDSDSEDGIPEEYMHLGTINWQNLVARPCDNVNHQQPHDLNISEDILTPELTPSTDTQMEPSSSTSDHIRIIMDATENQKAAKVNELLRNTYKVTPKIRSLDFVQYVIGDSIAIVRKKEKDMVKGEQILALKGILHRATDRYKEIIFILQRMHETPKHRTMGLGVAKKLDRNLQQITLSPRVTLIECVESEQVAETIVYCMNSAAKTNKNNVIGVPMCDELEYNDAKGINEQKLMYLTSLPQIGYSEAVWLLREFDFNIQKIVNCPAHKLAERVPSLAFNDRHKFIKLLMTHQWQKGTAQEDEEEFDKYMKESSAVKLRKILKRTNLRQSQ
eukprot:121838_1